MAVARVPGCATRHAGGNPVIRTDPDGHCWTYGTGGTGPQCVAGGGGFGSPGAAAAGSPGAVAGSSAKVGGSFAKQGLAWAKEKVVPHIKKAIETSLGETALDYIEGVAKGELTARGIAGIPVANFVGNLASGKSTARRVFGAFVQGATKGVVTETSGGNVLADVFSAFPAAGDTVTSMVASKAMSLMLDQAMPTSLTPERKPVQGPQLTRPERWSPKTFFEKWQK
jgi:hypothetical protein